MPINGDRCCAVVLVLFWLALFACTEAGWVDPDTLDRYQTTRAFSPGDDRSYRLVFSDEFNQDGRTFHDGQDPRWTAMNKNDHTNNPLHYYSHDAIHTTNGVLNVTIDYKPKEFKIHNPDTGEKHIRVETKFMRSGMLQSWNKFCFIGGIVEFSAKLPGSATVGGLWPAIWMMGNLARATYVKSTDYMWPYSTNVCDDRTRYAQEINSCSRFPRRGRGAAEIDIVESMYMHSWPHPVLSSSLQVAPGIDQHRPAPGHPPNASQVWYQDIEYGIETQATLNTWFYGVKIWRSQDSFQTDALSANMNIDKSHFMHQHLYRLEWEPPERDGSGGYLRWYIDGKLITGVHGESLQRLSGTEIPSEPMYLLMNIALSKDWAFPDAYFKNCKCKCYDCANPCCRACALPVGFCGNLPASWEIDHVRVYQAEQEPKHVLGCSPKSRPTKAFIEAHLDRFMVHNQTRPLEPVIAGGASCWKDDDCGGDGRGTCSSLQSCICTPGWTGPKCLAHDAFYDSHAGVRFPFILGRATVFVGAAVLLFMLVRERRQRAMDSKYCKVPEVPLSERSSRSVNSNGERPYQQEAHNMTNGSRVSVH